MSDFGSQLLARLDKATNRNEKVQKNNEQALEKLDRNLPTLNRSLQGNQVALAAIREVYSALEGDGEELQTVIVELKEAKDQLEITKSLLEQAGYDFANIGTAFGGGHDVWIGNHLPTIKKVVDSVDIPLFEIALDEAEKERFEDISHAVMRSGKKREEANPV